MITVFTHVVHASQLFKIKRNITNVHSPSCCGLAEGIIDNTCHVLFSFQANSVGGGSTNLVSGLPFVKEFDDIEKHERYSFH